MNGWMGQILFVDLSAGEIRRVPTDTYAGDYVGGRGIAARIYWEMTDPAIGAFDPGNPLIFMTGPLVGSRVQAATVVCVVAKSPSAFPESYCYGSIAGYFAAELKKAGYDGLVVTGSAPRPVYLWIDDGRVEIRSAADLWGLGAYHTGDLLRGRHGDKTKFVSIGVAGENLVRTATVLASHESALSCGFGAVMGSKKLKGIAVNGTRPVSVADSDRMAELNRHTVRINKRLHLAIPPDTANSGRGGLLEVIGRGGCHLCGAKCIRNVYRYDKRLEGLRHCQTMEYYLPWIYGRAEEPVDTFFHAPTLANDYGIDTFELRSMVNWLYACHQAAALTEADTGLPLSKIGSYEFLDALLRAVAYRDGLGDALAEGMVRAASAVPEAARRLMGREVAPIGQFELRPPRMFIAHALLYPLEPRVHQPLVHDIGMVHVAWMADRQQPGATNVTNMVVRKIAKAFWGSEEAGVMDSYEGKALAAKLIQDRVILKDSLGLCDFTWPITYSFATEDHVGDPGLEAACYSAVTGSPSEELARCAERTADLQRAILIREGRRVPDADRLPDYHFTEPLADPGMHGTLVPSEDDRIVDMAGYKLDEQRCGEMLREYYRLRGWDELTGIPTAGTLTSLGLTDAARSMHVSRPVEKGEGRDEARR
jgi:aldehyde:ferredoxin oxidoreductase